MAIVTNKATLVLNTDVIFDFGASTFQIVPGTNVTAAADGGVRGKTLASFWQDAWKSETGYDDYFLPIRMADGPIGEMLIVGNGWTAADATTLKMIRDCGLAYENSSGVITTMWACPIQAGTIASASDQPYYRKGNDTAKTDFDYPDAFNGLILIYTNGGDDDRSALEIFIREQGKTFGYYDLIAGQSLSSLIYRKYVIPMTTATDANIVDTDAAIGTDAPYTSMVCYESIDGNGFGNAAAETLVADDVRKDANGRWFICTTGGTVDAAGAADYTNNGGTAVLASYSGEREVVAGSGTYYAFNKVITGNSGTRQQIYTFHQYKLRQTGDIDTNTGVSQVGNLAQPLLSISADGATITTSTGVIIDGYQSSQGPSYTFTDVLGATVSPAFSVEIRVSVSDVWQAGGWYRVQFKTGGAGEDFDTANAVTVNDASGNPVAGDELDVLGSAGSYYISFTFDYDGNTQAGLSAAIDKTLVFTCGGYGVTGEAMYTEVEIDITRIALITAQCLAEAQTV